MIITNRLVEEYQKTGNIPIKSMEKILSASHQDCMILAESVIRDGWVDRNTAGTILGNHLNKTYHSLESTILQHDLLQLIPKDTAIKLQAIPIYKMGNTVTVAMADPENKSALTILKNLLRADISPLFSLSDEIQTAISVNYHDDSDFDILMSKHDFSLLNDTKNIENLSALAKSKPVVELVDTIILFALKERASDIHIEPKKNCVIIRMRIDGAIIKKATLPKDIFMPMVSRIKVISRMDIIERRKPQDGRFSYKLPMKNIDIRVSTIPTMHGEKVVLRILGSVFNPIDLDLDKMDIEPSILAQYKHALDQANGLILVTGPTGSGKTTTLHASLNYTNQPTVNVVTIEDPIEYENPAITQVAVDEKAGLDFKTVLRSILRQDPDIILVGETRDYDTAKISTQAALTGHLVLTSLHTNNAIQAITRLIEIGVERHMVAPSITGILGQRLARRICTECRISYLPDPEELKLYFTFDDDLEIPKLYKGQGCKHCNDTGYFNMIAIHEFIYIDTDIRNMILKNWDNSKIRDALYKKGFTSMRYDGLKKTLRGLTTLDEIIRITAGDTL